MKLDEEKRREEVILKNEIESKTIEETWVLGCEMGRDFEDKFRYVGF